VQKRNGLSSLHDAATPQVVVRASVARPGQWRVLCRVLALAFAASGCDESFYFDVPGRALVEDAGRASVPGQCSVDMDCPLDSLHCEPSTRACFECVVDQDCTTSDSRRCDDGLHRCVECKSARDCPASSTCDSTTHRCLASCVEEYDCAISAHGCDERRGVCIQCDRDEECALVSGANHCAFDGTGCVACRMDSNCGSGQMCDILSGRCVECRDTRDCASGDFCDPATYRCVAAMTGMPSR
jgi:hypothetical protein